MIEITSPAFVSDTGVLIMSKHERENFAKQIKLKAIPGKYTLILKKNYRKASKDQFGWLFSGVYPEFLKGAIETGWEIPGDTEKERLEYIDAWCKQMFAKKEVINRDTGQIIDIPELKRKMKTVEMMAYVSAIRNHSEEFFGHYIPEPETNWKINFENE